MKVYRCCVAAKGTDKLALLEAGHGGGQGFAEKGREDGGLREEGNLRPYLLAVEKQVGLGLLVSPL